MFALNCMPLVPSEIHITFVFTRYKTEMISIQIADSIVLNLSKLSTSVVEESKVTQAKNKKETFYIKQRPLVRRAEA